MAWLGAFFVVASAAVAIVGLVVRSRRRTARWQAALAELARIWHQPLEQRLRELGARAHATNGPLAEPVLRAAAWYLIGCSFLDDDQPDRAARAFQIAYHEHPGYESAALLAFTCMRISVQPDKELLPILLETWGELDRPALLADKSERQLLAAVDAIGEPPARASVLAAGLWAVPVRRLRAQLAGALANRPAWAAPLVDPASVEADPTVRVRPYRA